MQYIIAGLSNGGLYAILGLGLVLTFRSTKAMNFAQGDLSMFLAFICFTLIVSAGIRIWLALALTLLAAGGIGTAIYGVIIYPNRKKNHEQLAIITLGIQLSLIGLAGVIWGPQSRVFPHLLSADHYQIFGLVVAAGYLWTLAAALLCFACVSLFLRYTEFGLAMRVAAENVDLAQLLGVNVRMVGSAAWISACCLGAVTGILLSLTVFLSPYMMGLVILKAFAAMVLGGMTSVSGVMVGGLCVGLLEVGVAYLLTPLLTDTVSLAVIIVVLMIRPQGLFAGAAAWRA